MLHGCDSINQTVSFWSGEYLGRSPRHHQPSIWDISASFWFDNGTSGWKPRESRIQFPGCRFLIFVVKLGTEFHTWIQDLQPCGELWAEYWSIDVARGSTPRHMRAVVCWVGLVFGKEMKKESCIFKHDSIAFHFRKMGRESMFHLDLHFENCLMKFA